MAPFRWIAQRERYRVQYVSWASGRNKEKRLETYLRLNAAKIKPEGKPLLFGVAKIHFSNRIGAAIVVSDAMVTLDGSAKNISPCARFKISGGLRTDADLMKINLHDQQIGVTDLLPQVGQVAPFEVTLDAPSKPGVYFVELRGHRRDDTSDHLEQLALFPIYVGRSEPSKLDPETLLDLKPPDAVAGWSAVFRQLVDQRRQKLGLPATLTHDALAGQVAKQLVQKNRDGVLQSCVDTLQGSGQIQWGVKSAWGSEADVSLALWVNVNSPSFGRMISTDQDLVLESAFDLDDRGKVRYLYCLGYPKLVKVPGV